MKKIVLALVVAILAAPALAVVNIDAVHEGNYVVRIDYSVSGEPNKVRAFALDLDVDNGQTINDINSFFVGECNSVAKGYGIFPGSIVINASGVPTDYNNPVAPQDDPGAAGKLGEAALTIEMGSLYEDSNYPADSGTLCRITVSGDTTLCISANAERSGVVLENGASSEDACSPVSVNSPCIDVTVGVAECMMATHPAYSTWLDPTPGYPQNQKPDCWCYRRQCRGDADGDIQYGLFWVLSDDLTIFAGAYGKQDVDLPAGGICADFDHLKQYGLFRVLSDDLTEFATYYGKQVGDVPECDGTHINEWKN